MEEEQTNRRRDDEASDWFQNDQAVSIAAVAPPNVGSCGLPSLFAVITSGKMPKGGQCSNFGQPGPAHPINIMFEVLGVLVDENTF